MQSTIARHRRPRARLAVAGDTNGKVGSIVPEAVGDHGAKAESENGEFYHQLLLDNSCGFLPRSRSSRLKVSNTPSSARPVPFAGSTSWPWI